MNKKILLVAAVGVGAIAMLAGFGPGRFGPGQMDPQKAYRFLSFKVDSALDDVKATEAQRTQVNAVKDDLYKEGLKLKEGQDAARKELVAQWQAPKVDAARVHAVVDERIDAVRGFAHRAADAAIRIHDLLSSEQRAQLKASLPQHGGGNEP
jgi:Spy/CpxP family protein refolding chaperone